MDAERFEFGRNWQSYAQLVSEERIAMAEARLAALLGARDLGGRSFLDIGCGSGLHALAALRLGAGEVTAVDLDANSVAAARSVLERLWTGRAPILRQVGVFELASEGIGAFDIVYSWGVLHHTGDMNRAIRAAAAHVKPGGLFALALYGKTPYCGIWKRIKRWYVNATPAQKARAEAAYVKLFAGYLRLRGKRLADHVAGYEKKRGMEFLHDVRDWIGGHPYESIAPRELARLVEPLGFERVAQNVRRRSGLFGSGNDEYLYRRCAASSA